MASQDDNEDAEAVEAEEPEAQAKARKSSQLPPLPDERLDAIVEALLFACGEAITAARLAEALGGVAARRVKASVERLRRNYQEQNRAFDVLEIAGGYRLYTRPEYHEFVERLDKVREPEKLSAAALETLAIIAYRQPIVRAEIDSVRGVQCGPILRSLMDRKLIRIVGRSDQPGRPLLYGTTKRFLDHFGLESVRDLPGVEDVKRS
jgi:segregation and condensation protein B